MKHIVENVIKCLFYRNEIIVVKLKYHNTHGHNSLLIEKDEKHLRTHVWLPVKDY